MLQIVIKEFSKDNKKYFNQHQKLLNYLIYALNLLLLLRSTKLQNVKDHLYF